jgi:hypothetical protein
MTHMTFVDFLEALGRIAVFKPLPDKTAYADVAKALEAKEKSTSGETTTVVIKDCAQFFAGLTTLGGEHQINKFNAQHERDWQLDETREGRPLPDSIELVCQLLIGRIDRDGDGQISRKDWKLRPADINEHNQVQVASADLVARAKRESVGKPGSSSVQLVRDRDAPGRRSAKQGEFERAAEIRRASAGSTGSDQHK